ncbi:MAG: hypothetical protein ABW298_05650 [Candidatus Binatia bacterium]
MSRRRRTGWRGSWWLWFLGALAGAGVVYVFFSRRCGSGIIPVPGRAVREETAAPAEEIHPAEREQLERVLRERGRAR